MAQAPLAELDDYPERLKAMTGGNASYTLELADYDFATDTHSGDGEQVAKLLQALHARRRQPIQSHRLHLAPWRASVRSLWDLPSVPPSEQLWPNLVPRIHPPRQPAG